MLRPAQAFFQEGQHEAAHSVGALGVRGGGGVRRIELDGRRRTGRFGKRLRLGERIELRIVVEQRRQRELERHWLGQQLGRQQRRLLRFEQRR
jgi:hypothetical protein